ncbi:MAG: aldo/keto reductase, partial [Treponema sp.]|nr:aldo/keto reductase [Treponema sp.]
MSRLALGTVQFGMSYGISNTAGRVPQDEVGRILDYCKSSGIDTLDTAQGYGESEKVLGQFDL